MHNTCQKHLGMHLHEKLNFNHNIKKKMAKVKKVLEISKCVTKTITHNNI